MAKIVTVRTLLAVAMAKGYKLHHIDVHNTFFHGDLTEEVCMKYLLVLKQFNQIRYVCFRNSSYGLRQAPRCWFSKLSNALKQCGFKYSYADYLFIYERRGIFLCVLIYWK